MAHVTETPQLSEVQVCLRLNFPPVASFPMSFPMSCTNTLMPFPCIKYGGIKALCISTCTVLQLLLVV